MTIVDDDIDVFDPTDVEWAVATRVQADRDVLIVSNARSKPLDPSLPPTPGRIPTTAKMGIDATIPEDVPRIRYNRIVYFNQKKIKLADYLETVEPPAKPAGKVKATETVESMTEKILESLARSHRFFPDLLEVFPKEEFRSIAEALGMLHQQGKIVQDKEGKYQLKEQI